MNTGVNVVNKKPAVHSDGSVLTKLFLGLVHLTYELYEAVAAGRYRLGFRPIGELELTHSLGLTVACVCNLELSQDVLGHVVLGHGVNHKVLVTSRPFTRPVLVTLLLVMWRR